MAVQFLNLQAAYDSVWLNEHADQPARGPALLAAEFGMEAEDVPPTIVSLITPPPPPNSYVCNPAHIFVHSTMKDITKPLVFDQFYETVLQGIDYAIDNQGRSYLNIRLQVLNDKP